MSASYRGATRSVRGLAAGAANDNTAARAAARVEHLSMRRLQRELKALGVPAAARSARRLAPFLRGLGRALPYAGALITAYELWQLYNEWQRYARAPLGPWTEVSNCGGLRPGPMGWGNAGLSCGPRGAFPSTYYVPGMTDAGYIGTGGQMALRNWIFPWTIWENATYERQTTGLAPWPGMPVPVERPVTDPLRDPNVQRDLPSTRPVERPAEAPQGDRPREPGYDPPRDWSPEQGRSYKPYGRGVTRPAPRSRPSRRTDRHNKNVSRSRKLSMLLFNALDVVSEYSEIVDAFYEALPDNVRYRWEKRYGYHWASVNGQWKWLPPEGGRALLDNAGQYGIDGADWKAKAIYHNYGKLDVAEAVENIIKNNVEDDIIGAMHRLRPANSGRAFEQGDSDFGQALNAYLDDVVSFDKLW